MPTPAAADAPPWTLTPSAGTSPARPYIYAEGTPGTVLEDKVAVTNPTTRPLGVTLRATGPDAWITFAERSVRVPARTRAEVPLTITVPRTATPGDYPGTVVADAEGRTSGVAVHLRVSGPTLSALTVEHVRMVDGDRITYDVVNRGNTTLTPRLAVTADGLLGSVLDKAPRTLPLRLPPGRRAALSEPWPDAPTFDAVEVKVTVTAGGGARDSATATARFVPWGPLGGALALAAVAVGAVYSLVRHRHRHRHRHRQRHGTGAGDVRSAP
ncbi:COG1470 family protein [Streptomyces sp. SGAir0957]